MINLFALIDKIARALWRWRLSAPGRRAAGRRSSSWPTSSKIDKTKVREEYFRLLFERERDRPDIV